MFIGHIEYTPIIKTLLGENQLCFFEISTNNKGRVFQNYCIQFRIK